MTLNAQDMFVMQLARAAGRQANKFLRTRDLQKEDRDDVIAAAMLWCWENRDNYSLVTTLETWFMNAVRDAYKNFQRDELPPSDELVDAISGEGEDPTYSAVAAEDAARALIGALTPVDRKIAILTMQGYTYEDMIEKGISHKAIQSARSRIKQLRRLMPDEARSKRMLQSAATASSDDADDQLSEIDMDLQALEFAPPAGKDCPPCWRCMWFEGFMPAGKRDTRMEIEDQAVREAVKNTEARKVEVAQLVRDGNIQFIGIGRTY